MLLTACGSFQKSFARLNPHELGCATELMSHDEPRRSSPCFILSCNLDQQLRIPSQLPFVVIPLRAPSQLTSGR